MWWAMQFSIKQDFWSLFPEAMIGFVVVRGIDNQQAIPALAAELAAQSERVRTLVGEQEIGSLPAVLPWRNAYKDFGVKASKFRSSIEGMIRSAKADRVRPINPLVDAYNIISLRHLLPCGGEDLHSVEGDIRLTRAVGDEHFVPLGSEQPEPPPAGAVIYLDDAGVICSCWNWREAERTKLTPETTDAILVIEAIPPITRASLAEALEDLATIIDSSFKVPSRSAILDRTTPSAEIGEEPGE
jgi:DNA/RNA-binding domain of Phe-tRNA-synthetase-like protein